MTEITSAARQRIAARTSGLQSDIVDLACRLIAIPTESPPGRSYAECADLLGDALRRLDVPCDIVPAPEGRYVVVAGLGRGPTVYLHGHYDVVPVVNPAQFRAVVDGNRLVGRGSADMKGAVAAMVYALHVLRSESLTGRVSLVVVPDEEVGGRLGSQYLAGEGRLGRDGIGAVLGEPTGGVVWNGSRGAITLRVRLSGHPAHVGLHHEGTNAFELAIPILSALEELKVEIDARVTAFEISPAAARHSILMLGGEVCGGHQFNVVPDRFSFTIERRFNPEEDREEEKHRLLDTIEGAAPRDAEVTIDVIQEADASATDAGQPLAQAVATAVTAVTGSRPQFALCPGLLESRFYTARGVPAVAYGPGDLSVSHGPDEWVRIDRLVECAEIYALTTMRLLTGS